MTRISIYWTQRGHSSLDPCGSSTFDMSVTWTVCQSHELKENVDKAMLYADTQLWEDWHIKIVYSDGTIEERR